MALARNAFRPVVCCMADRRAAGKDYTDRKQGSLGVDVAPSDVTR